MYEYYLICFAALILVPLGLYLLAVKYWFLAFPAAVLLTFGYYFFDQIIAPYFAIFYLFLTFSFAVMAFFEWFEDVQRTSIMFLRFVSIAYLFVAAFWANSYLWQYAPLGFSDIIVSLTAAHFHVAGFVMTTFIYMLHLHFGNQMSKILATFAIFGMPLVAFGIVMTFFGFHYIIEMVSALLFVLMSLGVIYAHIKLAIKQNTLSFKIRFCWALSSIAFLIGISLATLYALRFIYPIAFINIINMKIWHGSINTFGFGFLGMLGWLFFKKQIHRKIIIGDVLI